MKLPKRNISNQFSFQGPIEQILFERIYQHGVAYTVWNTLVTALSGLHNIRVIRIFKEL